MASINQVILIGRLGKDPELNHTPSGNPYCKFSIATSKKWKTQGGEQKEKTTWHNIIVWGKMGLNCEQYLSKGSLVYIEGEIDVNVLEKDGDKKYFTSIVGNRVQFLDSKNSSGGASDKGQSQNQGAKDDEFAADDIPF